MIAKNVIATLASPADRRLLVGWLVAALLPGCGPPQVAPSDTSAAVGLVRQSLDHWQQGRTPEQLRDLQPPVYVVDDWWHNGYRLDDYTIQGDAELVGTNVRVVVRLQASEPAGNRRQRTQAYLVTTTPALTVAREDR